MFFNAWSDLLRVLVVGVPTYLALVLFLRVSGKRTLSKMNAFDLVVTVALGSVLATSLLSKDVSMAEGLAALAMLIALQYALTWSATRWSTFRALIKARPTLLAYDGEVLREAMLKERVSDEELAAAVRDSGLPGMEQVHAVVMETTGELTVLGRNEEVEQYGALEHVEGLPEEGTDRDR